MRAVLAFGGRVVTWVVILGATAVVLIAVLIPRLAGATPYTILTGSMSPTYPPGTLVVVRPTGAGELKIGDVVTVQLESGEDTVVTHRIAAVSHQVDGDLEFTTKGDANSAADREPRLPVQIRGVLWYAVPYLGYVATALTGGERQWLVTAIAIGLLCYAAVMLLGSSRSRRAHSSEAPAPVERPAPPEPPASPQPLTQRN